ncbi:MAG: hypothetical protein J0H15_01145 [Xanthomonadales bacterium]|nr:hypothetical protein [Xanthomonadales bacterium]
MRHRWFPLFVSILLLATASWSFAAEPLQRPWSLSHPSKAGATQVPMLELAPVDQARLLQEDADAHAAAIARNGAAEKRLRVGVDRPVDLAPGRPGQGLLQDLGGDGQLWRIAIHAEGATDLRLGFDRFDLPLGATLFLLPANKPFAGPYTDADRGPDGSLWLPPMGGDALTIEVHVPAGSRLDGDRVHLSMVGAGYRNVTAQDGGEVLLGAGPSGTCNVDVVCPLGDPYRDEIRAVAKFYFQAGGTYLCTGTLVNNVRQDFTPYFLTANHCISTASEAASMTLFWNYQSPTCGQHGGANQNDNTQTGGGTLVARRADVDFSLVRLNSTPPEAFNVYYAGWDASGAQPAGSIGIHHPSGWVKAITEDSNGITTMNSCIGTGGSNTHWRTGQPYSQGTTEGGSSGSLILVPAGDATAHDRLVIGVLSGGSADCNGSVPNSGYDCYGKVSVAWDGSAAASRLKDWLDPDGTGATTLPGTDPAGDGGSPVIEVSSASLSGSVEEDGATRLPFTIGNTGKGLLSWTADAAPEDCGTPGAVSWLSADPASGNVAAGSSANVDAAINAAGLALGSHSAVLCIHSNDAATPLVQLPVSIEVTLPDPIFCSGFEQGEDGVHCGGQLPAQPVQDPGFEATTSSGGPNPFWQGTDSNDASGTPFYVDSPRNGSYGVWAGGWRRAGTQTWSQQVAIPGGGARHLTWWRYVDMLPVGGATLTVSIDGTTVFTFDATANGVDGDWVKQSVDVGAFADGAAHEITFTYTATGSEDGNLFVDDVTIESTP